MRTLLVAAALGVLISGCGVSRGCLGCAAPTSPQPSVPAGPAAGFDVLITDRDQAVTVHAGQRVEVALRLRPGMTAWQQIRTDDTTVLQPVPTGITAARGVTIAGFAAIEPGSATIISAAGPQCSPGQACPMYELLFSVRVTVI